MLHSNYIKQNLNSVKIYETKNLGTQCVALAKDYSLKVLGIKLGVFGNSAFNGWLNIKNTFKEKLFTRITNDINKKNQVPPIGSIIFFKKSRLNGYYGHVGIVTWSKKGVNKIKVLNQNVGSGDGKGYDDRVKITTFNYNNVLGWYVKNTFNNKYVEERVNKIKILLNEIELFYR